MFTFKKYDECMRADIPQGYIGPELRNDFYYSVGVEGLDNVLFVRFTPQTILFFCDMEEAGDVQMGRKVVASISLTNVKETGNDILNFAKDADLSFLKIDEEKLRESLQVLCGIYASFPFAARLKKSLDKEQHTAQVKKRNHSKEPDKTSEEWEAFLKFCLLEFVDAVDTHAEIFSIYPDFDTVRGKLRKSKVYRLLNAKLSYYAYRYKGRNPKSRREFSYLVRIYSDLLMDSDFNKIVPPTYFDGKGLFNNPEEELSDMVDGVKCLHRKEEKDLLERNVAQKIQSFFFTKHAVISAMMRHRAWRCLFVSMIVIMGLCSLVLTVACIYFDKQGPVVPWLKGVVDFCVDLCFEYLIYWDWICLGAIVLLGLLSLFNRTIHVFSLRILASIIFGWLTAFLSEDLIKAQLSLSANIVLLAWVGIMLAVFWLVRSEVVQHSPYHGMSLSVRDWWKSWRMKIIPTMAYSYFWALTIGAIMQFAFYDDLLKNSEILPNLVYKDTFDEAETYISYLTDFKEKAVDYRKMLEDYAAYPSRFEGNVNATLKHQDTLKKTENSFTMRTNTEFRASIGDFFEPLLESKIKTLKESYQVLVNEFYRGRDGLNLNPFPNGTKLSERIDSLSKNGIEGGVTFLETRAFIESLIDATNNEIKDAKKFIADNGNWDTLSNWSSLGCKKPDVVETYTDHLKKEAMDNNNLCRKVEVWWPGKDSEIKKDEDERKPFSSTIEMKIYPRMLIFHTLIVLVIAFVGQLIVSDKSITEPL